MAEWSFMVATSSKGALSPSPLAVFWVLLTAPAAGRAKLSATSTLATCVPRQLDATLQVYREP